MAKLTNETLMAYADGQLDPAQASEVEAMLTTDAEAAARVEALRRSFDLARTVMEQPLREPVPQALIETVLGKSAAEDTVVAYRRRWLPASRAAWVLPIAAALALTIGLAAYLGRDTYQPDSRDVAIGVLNSSNPLSAVLERTGSGQGVTLPGGRDTALVLATFRDSERRPCREFETLDQETHAVEIGIACRDGGGRWHVVGVAKVPPALATNGTFLPAGDHSNDPLQSVLKSIGAGMALSPDEEAALLARGWVSPEAN